ncbi:hypothetical protein [Saccharothrix coeruleofusca]|uniref:Tetratricopeptide repeat protein n=1 Tax=Saccharothrix coeruleofusca TaxID=33919 RepID=A0A918AIS1_9PSEU|nr:hypothetical protein [Saccharothrix coeruleofusca]GGP41978.1 hypothetical protein GCM10010185_11570 [Saccharothrix coeruleofusca]
MTKIRQLEALFQHSLGLKTRGALAALLTELSTLAGWQALDLGRTDQAWQHYERAKAAARDAGNPLLEAHARAEQCFVLVDVGESTSTVEQLGAVRSALRRGTPLLRAWLAAAHGEVLAAAGRQDAALRAFDDAYAESGEAEQLDSSPYLVLRTVDLIRWRGHALARFGHPDAVEVLSSALRELPADFVRAETGLLVDLALAGRATGRADLAQRHASRAAVLARSIGSKRQLKRLNALVTR